MADRKKLDTEHAFENDLGFDQTATDKRYSQPFKHKLGDLIAKLKKLQPQKEA